VASKPEKGKEFHQKQRVASGNWFQLGRQ